MGADPDVSELEVEQAREQALRYAADLARLLAEARVKEARRESLERLSASLLTEVAELVGELSVSGAAHSLSRIGHSVLFPEAGCAVFLGARALFRRARSPLDASFPARLPGPPAELTRARGVVAIEAGQWLPEAQGPLWGLELPARDGEPVGWLLAQRKEDTPAGVPVELAGALARSAGALLEDHRAAEQAARGSTGSFTVESLPGSSPQVREVDTLLSRIAGVDSTALLCGETGTGKSLAARLIHQRSPRHADPFVAVNCAAIPAELAESELFGHVAGAFSGALRDHRGCFERAAGGTVFLDEVGELSPEAQAKLLTFLEDRSFTPVGGETTLEVDVRVLAATNVDLAAAVEEGRFRADLRYRLDVLRVELPALRERPEDLPDLVQSLLEELVRRHDRPLPELEDGCLERIRAYGWPGNVRELRNVLERALVLSGGERLSAAHFPRAESAAPSGAAEGPASARFDPDCSFSDAKQRMLEEWESAYIRSLLELTGGNVTLAARSARMDKKNLLRKARKHGVDLDALRAQGPADA